MSAGSSKRRPADLTEEEVRMIGQDLRDKLPLKDRWYRLRKIPRCFRGSGAIDFVTQHTEWRSRQDALAVMRRLHQSGVVRHAVDPERGFDDSDALYEWSHSHPTRKSGLGDFFADLLPFGKAGKASSGPVAVPGGGESDGRVRCRVCEETFMPSELEEHTRSCVVVQDTAVKLHVANQRLDKLLVLLKRVAAENPPGLVVRTDDLTVLGTEKQMPAVEALYYLAESVMKDLHESVADASRARTEKLVAAVRKVEQRIIELGDSGKLALSLEQIAPQIIDLLMEKRRVLSRYAAVVPQSSRPQVDETDPQFFCSRFSPVKAIAPAGGKGSMPSIRDFEVVKLIAQGGFGKVYLARKRTTGDLYAIKVLRKSDMLKRDQVRHILVEKQIMSDLDSRFLVKLFYSFQSNNHLFLVMEYLPGGDCFSLLNARGRFDEATARLILAETILGIEHMHSRGHAHRDLKPDNLLFTKRGHVKLTDFGLSSESVFSRMPRRGTSPRSSSSGSGVGALSHRHSVDSAGGDAVVSSRRSALSRKDLVAMLNSAVGTPNYAAPEVIRGDPYGVEVDWWSVGCLAFEFLTGMPPFHDVTEERIAHRILSLNIKWPRIPQEMSRTAQDLIRRLLDRNPKTRLGAKGARELKQHLFFAKIDWESVYDGPGAFQVKLKSATDTSYFDDGNEPGTKADKASTSLGDIGTSVSNDTVFTGFTYKAVSNLELMNMREVGPHKQAGGPVDPLMSMPSRTSILTSRTLPSDSPASDVAHVPTRHSNAATPSVEAAATDPVVPRGLRHLSTDDSPESELLEQLRLENEQAAAADAVASIEQTAPGH